MYRASIRASWNGRMTLLDCSHWAKSRARRRSQAARLDVCVLVYYVICMGVCMYEYQEGGGTDPGHRFGASDSITITISSTSTSTSITTTTTMEGPW